MMDPVSLSRTQFSITTIYHFFFVPLTLGLSILVALATNLSAFWILAANSFMQQPVGFTCSSPFPLSAP